MSPRRVVDYEEGEFAYCLMARAAALTEGERDRARPSLLLDGCEGGCVGGCAGSGVSGHVALAMHTGSGAGSMVCRPRGFGLVRRLNGGGGNIGLESEPGAHEGGERRAACIAVRDLGGPESTVRLRHLAGPLVLCELEVAPGRLHSTAAGAGHVEVGRGHSVDGDPIVVAGGLGGRGGRVVLAHVVLLLLMCSK